MSEEAEILALASQRVGTVLHGKYHIDRVIGVGGMATVYAATHRNRKRFAVKMLHPEYSVRKDVRARFVREGYVANSVNHPGVVVVIDDDVDETGSAFLVMELLEGVTVDALYTTSGAPIPLRAALCIAHQLLDVLDAAHAKSVIHRDIKPANLFLSSSGQLKVVDFGIARLREADTGLKSTRTGAMLGTPAFMAPEQALATGEIDARTDIWAAGATLFTMLSARFVHEGDNARQLMIRAATEPARSLGSIMPELPASVVDITTRALMFQRADRWQSATAMRDAVRDAYQQLFDAEPSPSDLREIIERTSDTIETSPTEPSPLEASQERPAETRPSRTPGRERPAPVMPANRAAQTTASTPVSTRGNAGERKPPWGLIAAGAGAVAISSFFLLTRGNSPVEPRVVESAAPAASAPVAESAAHVTAKAPEATAEAIPSVSAPATKPSGAAAPSASSARATATTPRASTGARSNAPAANATKAEPATSVTTPSAPASPAPAANPLKLELQ